MARPRSPSRAEPSTPAPAAGEAPALAPLTAAAIAALTDPQSFSRGQTYARGGRIFDAVRRGPKLEAQCRGSSGGPYRVMATLATRAEASATNPVLVGCDCPRGGFCKHIVALLLTWIETPSLFIERPAIAELLAGKSQTELTTIIELLVGTDPDVEDRLLNLLELPLPGGGAPSRDPIDESAIRRQIATAIPGYAADDDWGGHGYSHGYDYDEGYYGSGVPQELAHLVSLGESYVKAADWRNALRVDATFVEEIAAPFAQMINFDEAGELLGLVSTLDRGLAAIMDAQCDLPAAERLSDEERQRLIDAIFLLWETDRDAGGFDLGDAGAAAIGRGATTEEKQAIATQLRQLIRPGAADDYTRQYQNRDAIRFLSRLGGEAGLSDEELLTEYRNAELWEDAVGTLVRLQRIDEAIALAARRLTAASSLTDFADRLIATGDPERIDQAISLVDGCLWEREGKQPHHDQVLSAWLERQYAAHGRPERSLELARRRFDQFPSRDTYTAVQTAACLPDQPGAPWPALRPELLAALRQRGDWSGLIDIHLAAGEVAEALAALEQAECGGRATLTRWGYAGGSADERVAAAAEAAFPDDAIRIYRRLADRQIAGRQRSAYHDAVRYLVRVEHILTAAGRQDEWRALIADLRQRHKTLRALQDELNQAGPE